MINKEICRILEQSELKSILPHDPRLIIEQLCIGVEGHTYSYIAPVSTGSDGRVSGGGSRVGTYGIFDFGYAVENKSSSLMRVQFNIVAVDYTNYPVKDINIWDDINPGEKKRIWAGLSVVKSSEFLLYRIKEIGIGPSPLDRRSGLITWTASTSPNKSIYELFNLKKKPLSSRYDKPEMGYGCFLFIAFIIAIGVFLILLATGGIK